MVIKNERLGDQLARELRRDILSGRRNAGELLIESALSEEYGLSRGPVRDAFQQLRQDGLIKPDGRSFRVADFTGDDIVEIYGLRVALEPLAVERALASGAEWSGAHAAIEKMRVAVERDDSAAFSLADLAFHNSLFEATDQPRVQGASRTTERTLEILLELTPALHDDLQGIMVEHQEILEAIESGDDRWRELLVEHLRAGAQKLTTEFAFRSNGA